MERIVEWATSVVEALGPIGVAALVTLENLFPPIPSEIVLPLAGFVAATGESNVVVMIAAATVGSMIGAYLLYGIAAAFGPVRLRTLVTRYGKWFSLTVEDLDRSEGWFDRYANRAILICRCIPLMRSLISVPAGLRRSPLVPFSIYTLIGSLVWNTALVMAGYLLGDNWKSAERPLELMQNAVLAVIGVAVAWFVWRRILQPRFGNRTGA